MMPLAQVQIDTTKPYPISDEYNENPVLSVNSPNQQQTPR